MLEEAITRHAEELAAALDERTAELTESHESLRRTEVMAVLGTHSSGIAHDLSNMLFPMEARLQALQSMDLPPSIREHIDGMATNIKYISDLARRLKKAIAHTGTHHPESEQISLARWCEDSESFLRSVVPSPKELGCDVPRGLPQIFVDRIGLTQAVYNLVQNAAKEMRKSNIGSRIIVCAATAHDPNGDRISLTVEDNGPGMSAEALARCMDPHCTTAALQGSMGLGLTLVKAFVDASCGTRETQSPPPEGTAGTRITLHFPTAERVPSIHIEGRPDASIPTT